MTGNDLMKIAFDLCGFTQADGTVPSDTEDLKMRAVSLINIVIAENAELDCRLRRTEHSVKPITSLEDFIDCTEIISQSVLPYGLARLFVIGEDDELASGFLRLYNDARNRAKTFGKARMTLIKEVY
jgi:hypothetical protein